MKKINIKTLCVFIMMFLIAGCYEQPNFSIITKVNLNGSCERIFIAKNIKSENLVSENFPISIDSTWEMTIQVDTVWKKDCDTTVSKVDTIYLFNKTFQSVEDLNKEYADTGNYYALLDRVVEFQKKFRWFYTYLEYTETYNKLFEGEPMTAYVTQEEYIAMDSDSDSIPLFEGLDSVAIEQKKDSIDERFFKWLATTFFNPYFDALNNQIKSSGELNKYTASLKSNKEKLFEVYDIFEVDYDDLYEIADSLLEARGEVMSLRENKDSAMLDVYKRIELWATMLTSDPFDYTLLMPGELSNTNADSIKGDTLQFVFHYDRFLTEDYKMQAETRIINKWSFYVSGVIVLLALITLLFGRRRR